LSCQCDNTRVSQPVVHGPLVGTEDFMVCHSLVLLNLSAFSKLNLLIEM